jgi:hypothetical protein
MIWVDRKMAAHVRMRAPYRGMGRPGKFERRRLSRIMHEWESGPEGQSSSREAPVGNREKLKAASLGKNKAAGSRQ